MQTMASIQISACQPDEALEWMKRSVSLWHLAGAGRDAAAAAADHTAAAGPAGPVLAALPPYDQRIAACKLLLELNQPDVAAEILLVMQAQDDEVVEVRLRFCFF